MDQAGFGSIPQTTIDQPASVITITITVLAARYVQLRDYTAPSPAVMAEMTALDDLMLHTDPTTPDEQLTLLRLVWEGIDDDAPLAGALVRVCRTLERDGARNLRAPCEEAAGGNDPKIW